VATFSALILPHPPECWSHRPEVTLRCRVSEEYWPEFRVKGEVQLGHHFSFNKGRHRGLDKNASWLFMSCALANRVTAKKTLLRRKPPPQASYACKAGLGL